jgi:hypothetical protein
VTKAHPGARITALVLALLWAVPALADTAAETAMQWGLIGTWSLDCKQPAARTNNYLQFAVIGADVVHNRNFGDAQDSNNVVSLKVTGDRLEMEIFYPGLNPPQSRFIGLMKNGPNKMISQYNHDQSGNFSVKDFKIVSNGQPSPYLTKCN